MKKLVAFLQPAFNGAVLGSKRGLSSRSHGFDTHPLQLKSTPSGVSSTGGNTNKRPKTLVFANRGRFTHTLILGPRKVN